MKQAAFFDVDGTLVRCITQNELFKEMVREKLLPWNLVVQLSAWFFLYKFGLVQKSEKVRAITYPVMNQLTQEDMDVVFNRTYTELIKPKIRSQMRNIVNVHKRNGDLIFAVSGSLANLCRPICIELGITELYATDLLVSNGRYTGLWKGHIFEGNRKVEFIDLLARKHEIDLSKSASYADSYSDLPMLQAVGSPIAVCPDARLKAFASRKGWQIILDNNV